MIFCATRVINFIGLLALAASLPLSERNELDNWYPYFTYPTAGSDVCVGGIIDVQWDTSNPPYPIDNPYSTLYLCTYGNVILNDPVAKEFPLQAGHVSVRISTETSLGPYQFALVGNYEHLSPTFNIVYC
ncbi:hypothetical protein L210DRAFT_3539715 [Boletus edulis BED1]|uniref:Uncharacterized protein n=1 Tax=Boletus edulis BED1 TaxID=1328754 RepID=A0AAD4BUI0_BOLED|nr:hypothetical protein L210DRAFT_3539715 [Boletus edulis BED1]